jgi:hypothetical protein
MPTLIAQGVLGNWLEGGVPKDKVFAVAATIPLQPRPSEFGFQDREFLEALES